MQRESILFDLKLMITYTLIYMYTYSVNALNYRLHTTHIFK